MKRITLVLFLFLIGCAKGSDSGNGGTSLSLIGYEKYDFVNSVYIPSNEILIIIYNNGFTLTKNGCDTVFYESSDTSLPNMTTKNLEGTNDEFSSCYPTQISIEITDNNQPFNSKKSFSVKILSDLYNMFLN